MRLPKQMNLWAPLWKGVGMIHVIALQQGMLIIVPSSGEWKLWT